MKLLEWYRDAARPLPWRASRDPYAIWVSEVMLQQTRAAVVVPYYERFLARFPTVEALARAPIEDVLACWSGLGYYSRARNLRKAAAEIASGTRFPRDYESIRALPGVGDYTAAAVASMAFGLPHAAVDGNVLRVLSRLTGDSGDTGAFATRERLREKAQRLLDKKAPGDFNQALMELGATVCLPRAPRCADCPIARDCQARRRGIENELPVKARRDRTVRLQHTLLVVSRNGRLLMRRREESSSLMAGFWELPEASQLPRARVQPAVGVFRHTITHHRFVFTVARANVRGQPSGFEWIETRQLGGAPLATAARKALRIAGMRI